MKVFTMTKYQRITMFTIILHNLLLFLKQIRKNFKRAAEKKQNFKENFVNSKNFERISAQIRF